MFLPNVYVLWGARESCGRGEARLMIGAQREGRTKEKKMEKERDF